MLLINSSQYHSIRDDNLLFVLSNSEQASELQHNESKFFAAPPVGQFSVDPNNGLPLWGVNIDYNVVFPHSVTLWSRPGTRDASEIPQLRALLLAWC